MGYAREDAGRRVYCVANEVHEWLSAVVACQLLRTICCMWSRCRLTLPGVVPSFHFWIMGASLMSKHSACARVLHAGILVVEVLRDRRLNSRRILGVVARCKVW